MNSMESSTRANSTYWYAPRQRNRDTGTCTLRNSNSGDGTVFGKTVEDFHDGEHYPVVEKYYINENR